MRELLKAFFIWSTSSPRRFSTLVILGIVLVSAYALTLLYGVPVR